MKLEMKGISYGGSSIPAEILRKALTIFKDTYIGQGYGLTEAVASFTALSHVGIVLSL